MDDERLANLQRKLDINGELDEPATRWLLSQLAAVTADRDRLAQQLAAIKADPTLALSTTVPNFQPVYEED